jgi:cytochrome c556
MWKAGPLTATAERIVRNGVMTDFERSVPATRRGIRSVVGAVVFGLVAATSVASGQDQSAATPKDAIFARKVLMNQVSMNMDELKTSTGSAKPIDMTDAHEHGDNISVLLLLFPHIFPPSTNQWKAGAVGRDPAVDTYASPDLWTNFADFYKRAADASNVAFKASRAGTEGELRGEVAQLRQACDGCHAKYQKTE